MSSLNKDAIKNIFAPNDGSIKKFNINDYKSLDGYVLLKDIIYAAYTNKQNNFLPNQYFTKLYFGISINDIDTGTFDLIKYLPNIINDIQNIDFTNDTTYIKDSSILENTIVNNVLNADKIQTFELLTNKIKSEKLNSEFIDVKNLKIDNHEFNDTIGYIYVNGFSLPIDKNEYTFSEFNLINLDKVFITLKSKVKVSIFDIENNLLFYYYNDSEKFKYMIDIFYNLNYHKIILKY